MTVTGPGDEGFISLKVGRTIHFNKRLDQWTKQCMSQGLLHLRGRFPTMPGDAAAISQGRLPEGIKSPFIHRLERLIHIELADLARYAPYLCKGFPHQDPDTRPREAPAKTACPSCEYSNVYGPYHNTYPTLYQVKRFTERFLRS